MNPPIVFSVLILIDNIKNRIEYKKSFKIQEIIKNIKNRNNNTETIFFSIETSTMEECIVAERKETLKLRNEPRDLSWSHSCNIVCVYDLRGKNGSL